MLPPVLRERFGIKWSRRQELEMRALARASRAATPLMPAQVRMYGKHYLRLRGAALTPFYAQVPVDTTAAAGSVAA
jgi:uncharacterized protein (DUF2236 family)